MKNILACLYACLITMLATNNAFAQAAVVPLGDDFIVVPTKQAPSSTPDFSGFDYQRTNERILTGFPIGHDLPKATNELFYNLYLDGYGGLPFGSCLYRSETLGQTIGNITRNYSEAELRYCVANENKDLMRVWANRNPNLKNVLLKNMTIKNAFRTHNVVDGNIVENSRSLPHTDTFQSFYPGSSVEDPDWIVIQDTLIKNSDNSLMISGGGRFKGAVYQNLEADCDQEFRDDTRERAKNDYRAYVSTDEAEVEREAGGRHPCSNRMSFSSREAATLWLIGVRVDRVQVGNNGAPVIVIAAKTSDNAPLRVTMRDSNRRIVDHDNVEFYNSIEEALNNHPKPPYIEMSCSGWQSPPRGCESRRGYLN